MKFLVSAITILFGFISGILLFQTYHVSQINQLKDKLEKATYNIEQVKLEKDMIINKLLTGHQKQLAENLEYNSKIIRVQATAYTAFDEDSMIGKEPDGIMATGKRATPGRDIAVDPMVIPYGTKVFIPDRGWRIANDTGGDIKGKKIDLLVKSLKEARNFGRQWITILVN